jgi:hypothetical protein
MAAFFGWMFAALLVCALPAGKEGREAGEFRIFLMDKEIGLEKYSIVTGADSIVSTSTVDYHSPTDTRKKVHLETRLEMGADFRPRTYQLKADINGMPTAIQGSFPPNEAIFEFNSGGQPSKGGLLMGDTFTVLDSNVFHHFIFLTRRFDFASEAKAQKFEVAIPQETDSGSMTITALGKESISVRGRKVQANHLQADSGTLRVQLWVDEKNALVKIAVPQRNLVVEKN